MLPSLAIYRGKNKSNYQKRNAIRYARNEYIKAPRLLVIDADGTQLGEIAREKALEIAKERELDLIEVAPNAKPPVAKIYDWSKFKYQQDKKRKENKGKSIEQKEMWFKSFIDKGDMLHKLKKVKDFLEKKHPVKITIRGKGRVTRDHMYQLMDDILAELEGYIKYDGRPKFSGRNMSLIVRPDISKKATDEKE